MPWLNLFTQHACLIRHLNCPRDSLFFNFCTLFCKVIPQFPQTTLITIIKIRLNNQNQNEGVWSPLYNFPSVNELAHVYPHWVIPENIFTYTTGSFFAILMPRGVIWTRNPKAWGFLKARMHALTNKIAVLKRAHSVTIKDQSWSTANSFELGYNVERVS